MELLDVIKSRRSVKKYKSDKVSDELINKVIEAGLFAASGMNRQDTIILAVTNKNVRDELAKDNAGIMGRDGDPFYNAPVVLVVLYDKSNHNGIYDGSLVMGNMMLEAHSLGLGCCWIHRAKEVFELDKWKEFLKKQGIKGEYEGVGNLVLGYIDGDYPVDKPRKDNRVYYIK